VLSLGFVKGPRETLRKRDIRACFCEVQVW